MADRPVPQSEFVQLNQFNASRMLWASENSLAAHEKAKLGNSRSARALRALIPRVSAHIGVRKAVIINEGKPTNPALQASDRKLDVSYSAFDNRVSEAVRLYGADSRQGQAATRLKEGPLGLPVASVTNVERVEQQALLKEIIPDLEANYREEIEVLELTSLFELLKSNAEDFYRELAIDTDQKKLPSRSQLEVQRKELQSAMLACIMRVLGEYPEATERDLAMRTKLLMPFAIENDRISAYHRRRRGRGNPMAPEIDPTTGEELAETDASDTEYLLDLSEDVLTPAES